jgi:hypothetical protein
LYRRRFAFSSLASLLTLFSKKIRMSMPYTTCDYSPPRWCKGDYSPQPQWAFALELVEKCIDFSFKVLHHRMD